MLNKISATHIFDREYLDFNMHSNGYFFVTRAKKNTKIKLLKEFNTTENSNIIADQMVILGSKADSASDFRLITVKDDDRIYKFIINRSDLTAEKIAEIYKSR